MKNKLLLIIGCAVIALSAIFLILYLVNSGLFAKPYNPPGALTTEIKLSDLGSASELNGNIAVVSIFADDKQGKWSDSKEDAEKISNIFGYTKLATDWLTEKAKGYGVSLNFVTAGNNDSDLCYRASFDEVCIDIEKSKKKSIPLQWEYINNNIDSEKLKEQYNCEQVVYLCFFNPEEESASTAYSVSFYNKVLEYPYEVCMIPYIYSDTQVSPAVIAHEMLHLFGAPDLYGCDLYDMNYGTTDDYVAYCAENHTDEIMYTTFARDENGNKYKVFDRITNDLTDITAYYVGWTDNVPPEVEKFGLVHSQHEYYKQNKRHNS